MSTHKGSQIIAPPEQGSGTAQPRPGTGKAALGIAGLLIALVVGGFLWYWNQTVSIFLEIAPANATVILDGKNTPLSNQDHLKIKRGKHLLEIVSPGYKSHQRTLVIGFGGSQSHTIALEEEPGLLSVITKPEGAEVTIDGKVYGPTPVNGLELQPGDHAVVLTKENYLPHTTKMNIQGKRERTRLETELTPAWSRVALNSSPEGATLLVNNEPVGVTPIALDLLRGNYDLRLEMPEREPQSFSIRVPANQTLDLPTRTLDWKHGSLFLGTSPEGAWVKADGEVLGQTPGTFSIPSKKPVEVVISLLDHEETALTLVFKPNETVERRIELKPLTGEIQIDTRPTKAEIYLDGRIQGLSPITMKLPVKDHAFEIRKAGYLAQSHTLRPLVDKTARFSFSLIGEDRGTPLTDDQIVRALIARKENMRREVSTPYGYTLKLIEPDTFTMGLPEGFPDRQFNETEIPMRIRQPFYLGLYEVTNREFKTFKADHDSGIVRGVSLQSGDRPVVNVSWRMAVEYCNWLSDVQGLKAAYKEVDGTFVLIEPRTDGYRLPTEAEWEYVARYHEGSANLVLPWGEEMPPTGKSGNFAGEEAKVMMGQSIKGYRDGYRATAPVGSFNPNPLGIFDLGGNVAEWCTDYYSFTYPATPRPLVDFAGPEKGEQRVIRGSSWRTIAEKELRTTAKRNGKDGTDDVGFRLARSYPLIIE